MTRFRFLLSLSSFLLPSAMKAEPVKVDRLIQCLIEKEQGEWGKDGGAACMMYGAWSDSSDLSYIASRTESTAIPVYRKHILEKIIPGLKRSKLPVTPQSIAACWNLGVKGGVAVKGKSEFGEHVSNLYFDASFK